MQCPFPGMDPYIERPAIWADFHGCLITSIRAALQPLLRPKYAALVQYLLYVGETKRPIRPDIANVETTAPRSGSVAVVVMELDQPVVFETVREEIRQPFIQIIEPAAGNRLLTAIEVLSPSNKARGAGRREYLKKRREIRSAGASLVEIDLLRAGRSMLRIAADEMIRLPPWRYVVAVTRRRRRQEVYAVPLHQRLPRIAVPLTPADRDVPLDLQAAFTRCWQQGPYPELLRYEAAPPGEMTPAELAWCDGQLRNVGLRTAEPTP